MSSTLVELELEDVGFNGGRKTGGPPRKTVGARRELITNSTHIKIWHWAGIGLGPHQWEASTQDTAPSLLLPNGKI